MNIKSFNFYGSRLDIEADDSLSESVLSLLNEDFEYFLGPDDKSPHMILRLYGSKNPNPSKAQPLFRTRSAIVHGFGPSRFVNYGDETTAVRSQTRSQTVIEIFSPNQDELYEFSYVAGLSMIGEHLDRKGLHRIHALGFSANNTGVLLVLPSGGGKSSLASLLLNKPEVQIFSDEAPLVSQAHIFAFPHHVALRPHVAKNLKIDLTKSRLFKRKYFSEKLVFQIPSDRVDDSKPIKAILVGRSGYHHPAIKKRSKFQVFALLIHSMVIGIGLAQMAEFMLRADNLLSLGRIALSRLAEALKICYEADCYEFQMTSDMMQNSEALSNFVKYLRDRPQEQQIQDSSRLVKTIIP